MVRLLFYRLAVATVLVGFGTLLLQLTSPGFRVAPLYIVLACVYGLSGVVWVLDRAGFPYRAAVWTLVMSDLTLVTALLYFSGGTRGPFALFYLLPVVLAAAGLKLRGGIVSATLASLAYGILGNLEATGVVQLQGSGWPEAGQGPVLSIYLHVGLFILVGYFAGALSEGVSRKSEELADAEKEITRIKLDTDSILQNMSSGVMTVDLGGHVVSMNPAAEQILKIDSKGFVGKTLKDMEDQRMADLALELERDLKIQRNRHRSEVHATLPDGEHIILGLSTSFLSDRRGMRRGLVAVFQDVTEVRKMQEEVRKADRLAAIGELAASIAHEIRNPLASIRGSIEFLASDLDVEGDTESLMDLVIKESDRLEMIITDFLEFARMPPQILRDTHVGRSIEQTLALLRRHPDYSSKLNIVYQPMEERVKVRVDEEQIRQVFLNLVLNACEAMQGEGTLTVSTRLDRLPEDQANPNAGRYLVVSFADDGPGIPDRYRIKILEPFFSTKDEGTGLGLSIAARIVAGHQGKLEVRNRDGGGAQFEVYLPLESSGVPVGEAVGAGNGIA